MAEELVYNSIHTGVEIDEGISKTQYIVNPNLLDNWHFVNPVNQRGQTEYTGNGYTIDRWRTVNAATVHTLTSNGIKVSGTATAHHSLQTSLENPAQYVGKEVTLSALITENNESVALQLTIYYGAGSVNQTSSTGVNILIPPGTTGLVTCTGVLPDMGNYVCANPCIRSRSGTKDFTVAAIKLELGSTQTLAHQDENGNWVLNEIPDYAEQLRRCRRYFRRLDASMVLFSGVATSADTAASFTVPHGEAMRANPSVNTSADFSLVVYTQTGYSSIAPDTAPFGVPSTVTCLANVGYGLNITATFATSGVAGENNTLIMVRVRTGSMNLSADL